MREIPNRPLTKSLVVGTGQAPPLPPAPAARRPDEGEGLPLNITKLLGQVRRLERLLVDPHPGLFTWQGAYWSALTSIAEWAMDDADAAASAPVVDAGRLAAHTRTTE